MNMDQSPTLLNAKTEIQLYNKIAILLNWLHYLLVSITIYLIVCVVISTEQALKTKHQLAIFLTISISETIVEHLILLSLLLFRIIECDNKKLSMTFLELEQNVL